MKGLLVRVGADQTQDGGQWNGPIDSRSGQFAYVPIPEGKPNRPGQERMYAEVALKLAQLGVDMPANLSMARMHLDPDFEFLTYGDRGAKGTQLAKVLGRGDLLVFYSGLREVQTQALTYAIIGLFIVDRIDRASTWPDSEAHRNAHTRRSLAKDAEDIIVVAKPKISGRLKRCIPVGSYRDRAYRVRLDLLDAWGGISANNGYLQRSAVFPSLLNAKKFWQWWGNQKTVLVQENNPE
ncbi:MAG: hypothetical protein ACLQO1_07750 [Steroidobacteraceae bacterium]